MEGSTLTRPRPGTDSARAEPSPGERGDGLAKIVFALLCVGFAIGFFVFPTYPVYDSYYSLLWGRDLLHGDPLVFDGFRYPTEHPLAIAAGAILQLFGGWGDRLWVAMILGSFLVLVAGVYRLGRIAATPLVGAIAAALLLTRFDYPFLAARGYIDIPYMALVVWAATLEATHRRRGVPVLILLALAGMLRPEAWFLSAMYWVWLAWKATWRERFVFAAIAASGPLVWCAVDFLVTGDPLFSLHYTSGSAEDLGRQKLALGAAERDPAVLREPGQAAGASPPPWSAPRSGVVISPRRMLMPIVLLRRGHRHLLRDRRRRRLGDRALPGRPGARADGPGGGRDRRLDDAAAGLAAHRLDGRRGADRGRRRGLHRDPPEPLALRQRAALPRPGARRSDRRPERSEGPGRPALRTPNRP